MTSTATRLFFGVSAAVLYVFTVRSAHAALSFVQNFGISGSGNGQFHGPTGIKVDSAGNLYVADQGNARIVKPTGAVPEPTSAALLFGGSALLALRRRQTVAGGLRGLPASGRTWRG